MAKTVLNPLGKGTYLNGKGAIFWFDEGGVKGRRIGDCDAMTVQVEVNESERYSNEYSTRTLALKSLDDLKVTVSMTIAQFSGWVRAAAVLGKETTVDQASQAGVSLSIADAGVYHLDGRGVTNVTVTKDGEPAVLDVDYMVDTVSGLFESLTGALDVTYDIPEISAAWAAGIASGTGMEGKMVFRGVNEQGAKSLLVLNKVQDLRPTGGRAYINESGVQTIEMSGTAVAAPGQPAGMEIGCEMTLED
jgi:hypothetical protein